ncbi:HDIG domain-containing protein [Kribbella solani]|uniref:HDIG domain-containing metalloprotein n=1 Tax=Kribbella solani TaxID=236067 RepID=UPI0029B1126D|nr:HDIG domain-containing metalloprotein [Kribbella solani]MDX2970913.1 HDIG domain-containing protein [Kribbella solani]MDX3001075.1 HDIG domain-containing protein [Kribbella solani]
MRVPTDREIRALHREYAPSRASYELVSEHCRLVCSVAEQFFTRLDLDTDLVRAGALLHDIGVYRLDSAAYIRHGVLGHELLASLGYPVELCRFASCHTGVGITREDVVRQGLPIPVADYVPATPEEELVLYADKFHSKRTPPVFLSGATYAAEVARFGADKVVAFNALRARYGEPGLGALSAATGYAVS